MTAAEMIAILQALPPDTPLVRSCGGDCIGYTELEKPREEVLYPHPEGEGRVYAGELVDARCFQAEKRCRESEIRWDVTYPLPEGKTYLVF